MDVISETKKIYLTPSGAEEKDEKFSTLSFYIPSLFPTQSNILYHTIRVLHCEIPYSWYIINEYNNALVLSTGTITIPFGNYNANSFMEEITPLLPTDMTITLNNLTGKFSLSYVMPFSILASTTCHKIIGMKQDEDCHSIDNVIELPHPCNFLGTKNLYINIPNLILDNFNSSTRTYSTLLAVSVTVSPYGILFYENSSNNRNIIKGVRNDYIDLQIVDDEFNPIDFNNTEWSIVLEIETRRQILYYNNLTLNN